jgi:RNA polymerase sigma-70 factor (ECF subfamily)
MTAAGGDRDDELWARVVADNDGRAFKEIYDAYKDRLYRAALRILRDPDDAEDATQRTLTRAWRYRGTYGASSPLAAWLYAILGNVCLNIIKERKKIPTPVSLHDEQITVGGMEALDARGMEALLEALGRLKEEERNVIILGDILGLPAVEVEAQLKLSSKRRKRLRYIGKRNLGERLGYEWL